MDIYLAILEDRHIDDQITPCKTLDGALNQIAAWKDGYANNYEWEESDITGWLYYCRSDIDDGPEMRIELKPLCP